MDKSGDPILFTDYYHGLYENPKLLTRSNPAPWTISHITESSGYQRGPSRDTKIMYSVKNHPLHDKLAQGLRERILDILATMDPCEWFAVDYVRIGYDKASEQNNPPVVLVTVQEDKVARAEGQRIVNALSEECRM